MPGSGRMELDARFWSAAAGATLGLAAGYLLGLRGQDGRGAVDRAELARRTEDDVISALSADPALAERPVRVALLSEGIVELTGTVRTEDEARVAVDRAQDVPGVTTVLNRLDVGPLESHLEETRRRYDAGDPALRETHWYGMGVGTGPRRQGHETDPDRPDDKVPIQTRELGTDRALEQSSETLDKAGPGREHHTSGLAGPLDRGTAENASHRRLGNVPEDSPQDLNPASGVHENVKEGTELTLEESGLEKELAERDRERGRQERG